MLSDRVHFWNAVILQTILVIIAISVKDLGVLFEIIGIVGATSLTLFFPAIAYIVSLKRFGSNEFKKKWTTLFWYTLSWFFLALYVVLLTAFFYVEIAKLMRVIPSDQNL